MPPARSGASASRRTSERIEHIEDAVLLEQVQHGRGAYTVNACRSRSTSRPGQRIDVAADQHDRRRSASRATLLAATARGVCRICWRRSGEAPTTIQSTAVAADGHAGLGRGPRPRIARPRQTAEAAAAVPLREAAARRRTENQGSQPGRSVIHSSKRRRARLHLAGEDSR